MAFAKRWANRLPALVRASEAGDTITFSFKGTRCAIYDVIGPDCGQVRITLDDGPESAQGVSRVLDADVRVLVNALWASGAEAVAVNGHRLTATQKDATLTMLALAASEVTEADYAAWLRTHTAPA